VIAPASTPQATKKRQVVAIPEAISEQQFKVTLDSFLAVMCDFASSSSSLVLLCWMPLPPDEYKGGRAAMHSRFVARQ
jgi:hypothetical protein